MADKNTDFGGKVFSEIGGNASLSQRGWTPLMLRQTHCLEQLSKNNGKKTRGRLIINTDNAGLYDGGWLWKAEGRGPTKRDEWRRRKF